MRLTHIKLSGFKSFVDATSIPIHSALVGVVGPNGCGKSNIMDAVRWVLGETRASQLRGDSMQDVIFNGASQRRPAGRAMVELVFDNRQGRAQGQWASYAELAVRRVLTRDGNSSYFINGQQVRRRDVHDLFLGTGLGARGYAIIGQGMINRLIEARPEELRVYLEEAAGVSRYKERRKDTEARLRDTRDNLARLQDIQGELDKQLRKLRQQAEVAQRYRDWQAEGDQKQGALWYLKAEQARAQQHECEQALAQAQARLDAQSSQLQQWQQQAEQARQVAEDSSVQWQQVQAHYYEHKSQVARLETQWRHVQDGRLRLQQRQTQLQDNLQQWQSQHDHAQQSLALVQEDVLVAQERLSLAQEALEQAQAPVLQAQWQTAQAAWQALNQRYHQQERQWALAQQAREAAVQQVRALQASSDPQLQWTAQEQADLQAQQAAYEQAQLDWVQAQHACAQALTAVQQAETAQSQAQSQALSLAQALQQANAEWSALQAIQTQLSTTDMSWLQAQGLADLPALWQQLRIAPKWLQAWEAVLCDAMLAVPVASEATLMALAEQAPPGRCSLYYAPLSTEALPEPAHAEVMRHAMRFIDTLEDAPPALYALLSQWLAHVYASDDWASAWQAYAHLPTGAVLVLPEGHCIRRGLLQCYAPDNAQAGLLARQQVLDTLAQAKQVAATQDAQAQLVLQGARDVLQQAQQDWQQAQQTQEATLQAKHQAQLALQAMQQRQAQMMQWQAQQAKAQEVKAQALAHWQAQAQSTQADDLADALATLQAQLDQQQQVCDAAQQAYEQAQRQWQEAQQQVKTQQLAQQHAQQRLREWQERQWLAQQQIGQITAELDSLGHEALDFDEEATLVQLEQARWALEEQAEALAQAEATVQAHQLRYREIDQARLQAEQQLQPQRDSIAQWQLQAQQARLLAEQYSAPLQAHGRSDQEWADWLQANPQCRNIDWLQSEVQRLQQAIAQLGAVNLAALQELEQAQERHGFLLSQYEDLSQAVRTLEDAIRKIDRETRGLLRDTFDRVNQHFAQLFPQLFGGGQAQLQMTGEEILDAGVLVMAQPPGKRNSTIALLSGGEKALTATALVFALFTLNPAPFCLLDEVDAPLDDANTERYAQLVAKMSAHTQFLFISHNKIAMQIAQQLVGVTMQEKGVSRIVAVDMQSALASVDKEAQ